MTDGHGLLTVVGVKLDGDEKLAGSELCSNVTSFYVNKSVYFFILHQCYRDDVIFWCQKWDITGLIYLMFGCCWSTVIGAAL